MHLSRFLKFLIISSTFLLLISGCNTVESNDGNVTVSFSTPIATQKIADNVITLDTIKILLRDIKLKNQATLDDMSVKVGPFVIYLNLNGITTDFAVGDVPPGTYNRIKFRVHTLEDSEIPPDPEFKDGSLRYSLIVKGVFNSIPFVYKSKKPAHQDLKLETPITVDENSPANLTITVDPSTWFIVNGNIIDPSDSSNRNNIDNNIKDSFKKCFKDNNHDGHGD